MTFKRKDNMFKPLNHNINIDYIQSVTRTYQRALPRRVLNSTTQGFALYHISPHFQNSAL